MALSAVTQMSVMLLLPWASQSSARIAPPLTALSDARSQLLSEHSPGRLTDEWLSCVEMEIEAAKKLAWE